MLSQFPDWRDIGKKIRDILHPFPRDHGPSAEERLAQRLQDTLKGFAYFDTVDEVLAWTSNDVDPIQMANTPLLMRPSHLDQRSVSRSRILLCHDYNGGYHDYESVRSGSLQDELYNCEYLQHIDSFVYFSHKLSCVPPPSWTNTLHRNGVKVLGTFLVEPQTPDIDQILTLQDGKYVMAEILAKMAHIYGFDGWLLNIEKKFASNSTAGLIAFIGAIKEALGDGQEVIWYDALTVGNEVNYQNGLTEHNVPFAKAAGTLFTNYRWTESKLNEAKRVAHTHGLATPDIMFGIDVWAQNTGMLGRPRVTFPYQGGGGTNTGLAIKTLNENDFSSAIFAPAWTYEHFRTSRGPSDPQSQAKLVDLSIWDGVSLPRDLRCDCKKAQPHHTAYYEANPITSNAVEFPAGSSTLLDTDFSRAFNEIHDENGEVLNTMSAIVDANSGQRFFRSTLGSQSVLPHLVPLSLLEKATSNQPAQRVLYGLHETIDNSSYRSRDLIAVYTKVIEGAGPRDDMTSQGNIISNQENPWRLHLFKVVMTVTNGLTFNICYSRSSGSKSAEVGIYAAFLTHLASEIQYNYYALPYTTSEMMSVRRMLAPETKDSTLVDVGFYCKGVIESPAPLQILRAFRFTIMPSTISDAPSPCFTVDDIRLVKRGASPNEQRRLKWTWHGVEDEWPKTMPWSKITGPFSHFTLFVNGLEIGCSYCLEYPLTVAELHETTQDPRTNQITFKVKGTFFGSQGTVEASRVCEYEEHEDMSPVNQISLQ